MPNPTSSPPLCYAWEVSVLNQFKLGKTKSNGIRIKSPSQRVGSNWWWANWIRVEYFPRIHHDGHLSRDWQICDRTPVWAWAFQRLDHLHVDVQRHYVVRTRKNGQVWEKSVLVANSARRFPLGHCSFLGPRSEKKLCETYSDKPDGDRDKITEQMMLNFAESRHPVFRATSALGRGELRSEGKGKKSIHFNGGEENIELILRTVISANQLSVYGAVADLCRELSGDSIASGKSAAKLWA